MTATAFPLVRPSSWCVSWSDTARDATTEPPSGIGLFVAQRDKFSDRLATRFSREEKFLCDVVARWHAMPRARTSFQRILCWCRGDAEGRQGISRVCFCDKDLRLVKGTGWSRSAIHRYMGISFAELIYWFSRRMKTNIESCIKILVIVLNQIFLVAIIF